MTLITIDVIADGLIIFARDEGPNLKERNRLLLELKQNNNISPLQKDEEKQVNLKIKI
jgi:hypothetical protein